MNMDDLHKLQRYIVKRYQDQSDADVIAHIEKVNKKDPLLPEQWESLLASACYYCAYVEEYTVFEYILQRVGTPSNIGDCLRSVVGSQEKRYEYILKRIAMLDKLLPYVQAEEQQIVLSEALLIATWYGELGVAKYLITHGADIHYCGKQGKNAFEFAQVFNERFDDDTLYQYLKPYYETGEALEAMEPYYGIEKQKSSFMKRLLHK